MLRWLAAARLPVPGTEAVTVLGNLHGRPVKAPEAVNQGGHDRGLTDVSRVSADYEGRHLLNAQRSAPHSIEAALRYVNRRRPSPRKPRLIGAESARPFKGVSNLK